MLPLRVSCAEFILDGAADSPAPNPPFLGLIARKSAVGDAQRFPGVDLSGNVSGLDRLAMAPPTPKSPKPPKAWLSENVLFVMIAVLPTFRMAPPGENDAVNWTGNVG